VGAGVQFQVVRCEIFYVQSGTGIFVNECFSFSVIIIPPVLHLLLKLLLREGEMDEVFTKQCSFAQGEALDRAVLRIYLEGGVYSHSPYMQFI